MANGVSDYPTIDGTARYIAFHNEANESGYRRIETNTPALGLTKQISHTQTQGHSLDYHHPAISADGRYLVYLESREDGQACQVHFQDRHEDRAGQATCTDELTA